MFVPEVMTCFKWQGTRDNILMAMNAVFASNESGEGTTIEEQFTTEKSIWKFYTRLSPINLSFFKTAGPKMLFLDKEFYKQYMIIK